MNSDLFKIEALLDENSENIPILDTIWELLQEQPLHRIVCENALQNETIKTVNKFVEGD